MSRVHIGSPALQLELARAAPLTTAAFTDPVATTTMPTVAKDCRKDPPQYIKLIPFGVGANNTTFTVRLIGWSLVNSTLWVPQVLCEFLATLSQFVGVSGGVVTDSQRFADTVADPTANVGREGVDCWKRSPANDTPAEYKIAAAGCVLFQVDINIGVSATSGNCLIGTE